MQRPISHGLIVLPIAMLTSLASMADQPKELQRIPLNAEDTLVVHAFLDKPTDVFLLHDGRSLKIDGTGVMIVMSFRSTDADRDSDWSWIKRIEVTEKSGDSQNATKASFWITTADGVSKGYSSRPPDRKERRKNGITYCGVQLPKIETVAACQYRVIDVNDQIVASIDSPLPPAFPSLEFNQRPHRLDAESAPWKVQLHGIIFARSTNISIQEGLEPHFGITTKFWFEHDGQVMQKNEVAVVDLTYSDALGNRSAANELPPEFQPRWKIDLKVARTDYMTNRTAKELRHLGKIDDLQSLTKIEPSNELTEISSAICFGQGSHKTTFSNEVVSDEHREYRGGVFGDRKDPVRFYAGTASRSTNNDNWSTEAKYLCNERNEEPLIVEYRFIASVGTTMTVKTSLPLVAIDLKRPLVNQILNVFAFDQLDRPLKVSSLKHSISRMPLYVVEADSDTKSIDLFVSIEDLVPLEMYIMPPTYAIDLSVIKPKGTALIFQPTEDSWILK